MRHDTEDLNRSGILDTKNCYLSFTIDLADSAIQDIRRDFPTYEGFSNPDHERDSWRKYKIDLSSGIKKEIDCLSALCNVQHIRIWFSNVSETVQDKSDPGTRRIQVAFLKFTK